MKVAFGEFMKKIKGKTPSTPVANLQLKIIYLHNKWKLYHQKNQDETKVIFEAILNKNFIPYENGFWRMFSSK